jgi:adenine-specific DNA methylase
LKDAGTKRVITEENNERRNTKMKGFSKRFEQIFTAITFAEAGEFETAREIMREQARDQKRDIPTARKSARISAPGAKR